MGASTMLARTEARLFFREPMALTFGLLFPPALLLAMGYLFPGFDEPIPDWGGIRLIVVYSPTVIGFALATLALMTLPTTLTSYRQIGILRRLRTTPVHPGRLLGAQVATNAMVGVVASAATIVIAVFAFEVGWPQSWGWFVLAFLLGMGAMFGLGVTISALAPSASSGQVLGFALFFPMLFFAGVYVPRPMMTEGLQTFSNLTPLGAAVQAMSDAWEGSVPETMHLVVLVAYAVVFGLVAVRLFRWE